MDLKYIIKDFIRVLRTGGTLQDFVDRRASVYIEALPYVAAVETLDGFMIPFSQLTPILAQVYEEYNYEDIRPTDIVLDLGANVGFFSMKVASKVKHVYAVEPLFFKDLVQNIERNHFGNITLLKCALASNINVQNVQTSISFCGKTNMAEVKSFAQILAMCGGHVDFLKCDCEGGEWFIRPGQIKEAGVRRIEMEFHNSSNRSDFPRCVASYVSQLEDDFDFQLRLQKTTALFSATKK